MQQNRRNERVSELIKRAVGEILRRMFSVDTIGVVSVMEVRMSSDLRSAVIFLSVLGDAEQQKRSMRVITEKSKLVQMELAQTVILKYMPQIRFQLDESMERGNRVLAILDELEKEGMISSEEDQ